MSFEALKQWPSTLRFRLTLWTTLVVVVFAVIALWAIREGLRVATLDMLNEFLAEEMLATVSDFKRLQHDPERLYSELYHRAWAHPRRALFIEVFDNSGQRVWTSPHTPELPANLNKGREIDPPLDVGDYRVMQHRLTFEDAPPLMLRVGCAESVSDRQLASLTKPLLLIGGAFLLLIPVGAYLLAGRATRPLANMIRTTRQLHPSDLNERLQIRGTKDELDQLAATINGFLDRIRQYLAQNRQLTDNVAHELRSPLTAMQFTLELALNSDRSTEEYKDILLNLLEKCEDLRTLVNRLLFLAEVDAGLIGQIREPIRLDEAVRKCLDMYNVVAESTGVNLCTPHLEPVRMVGDGMSLQQLVNNLVENALKFTPLGGTVRVEVSLSPAGQGILKVCDTGMGIGAADLPHIFERFYQADRSRERTGQRRGTGLGLSICKAIVAAHGGTIEVNSTLGKGTTFVVRLPNCSRTESSQ